MPGSPPLLAGAAACSPCSLSLVWVLMNSRLVISLLCAGALAFACGPRSRSEASTTTLATAAPTNPAVVHRKKTDQTRLSSNFGVKVEPQAVRFALNVTNVGEKRVELAFPSGQTYDFVVSDTLGREVWRWGTGRLFTQNLQNKLLGEGDSMAVNERWEPSQLHGKYVAVATLHSSNYPIQERVEFVLP